MKRAYLFMTLSVCVSVALAGCSLVPTQVPPDAGTALEGTRWTLELYLDSQGDLVSVLPDTEVTAQFEAGEIGGSAGCNRYFGSYEVDGDKLSIGPLASTEMYCHPDEVMDQEMAYLAALGSAASYKTEDDRLEIADSPGQTVLVFAVRAPAPLTGTTWQMMTYNNGREAVVSPLRGTDITALFGEGGSLTGSAGCNNYTTSYELDGDNITIGPIAITFMMCAEPEGTMEQESAYLAALELAATYKIEGDQLELLDAEGRRAVSYIAAPEQALAAYTKEAANQLGYGAVIGTLEPGKYADMVLLSADPLQVDPLKIKDVRVEATMMGGRVFYLQLEDSFTDVLE